MYKILGIMTFIALLMSGCGASAQPKVMEKMDIINPTIDGYPIDNCMSWAKDCRKPVADYICRQQGYSFSIKNST